MFVALMQLGEMQGGSAAVEAVKQGLVEGLKAPRGAGVMKEVVMRVGWVVMGVGWVVMVEEAMVMLVGVMMGTLVGVVMGGLVGVKQVEMEAWLAEMQAGVKVAGEGVKAVGVKVEKKGVVG